MENEKKKMKKMNIFQSMASKSHSLISITFWNGRKLGIDFEFWI